MALSALGNIANQGAAYVSQAAGPLAGQAAANFASAILSSFQSGREDYQVQYAFYVEIQGIMSAAFRSAGPFSWVTKVKQVREGGNNRGFVNLVEPGEFRPLVLAKGLAASNSELFMWMRAVHDASAPYDRRHVSVVMMTEAGEEAGRFDLYNAFPTKYELGKFEGKTNEVAIENIEITFDYFDFNAGSPAEQAMAQAINALPSMF